MLALNTSLGLDTNWILAGYGISGFRTSTVEVRGVYSFVLLVKQTTTTLRDRFRLYSLCSTYGKSSPPAMVSFVHYWGILLLAAASGLCQRTLPAWVAADPTALSVFARGNPLHFMKSLASMPPEVCEAPPDAVLPQNWLRRSSDGFLAIGVPPWF